MQTFIVQGEQNLNRWFHAIERVKTRTSVHFPVFPNVALKKAKAVELFPIQRPSLIAGRGSESLALSV
jgi:hypothetical protein